MKTYLVLDYETFSEADLKKVGGYEYARHPSTEILCCSFRIGTRATLEKSPTQRWIPSLPGPVNGFGNLLRALRDPDVILVAQNAIFEQLITRYVFGPKYMPSKPELQSIPIDRWVCTAALARASGLPGNLETAAKVLDLPFQKDMDGHKLMLKMCKPKKASKADPSLRHNKPEDLMRLAEYCDADIAPTVELLLRLPALHPFERKVWKLNQKMNLRGFAVDRELVKGALYLIALEMKEMDAEVARLTKGRLNSARQRDALIKELKREGLVLPNLQKETLEAVLKNKDIPQGKARRLLEIRDSISRSSTAKYSAFECRSRSDGRARDNTIYYGGHTGREAGTGLQPQNLFKTTLPQKDVELALELIRRRDVHTIRALFDRPMELYASALRSCIVSQMGCILDVGDWATIEVRVLFWLAGHAKGLKDLADGIDLYIDLACRIYDLDPVELKALYKSGDKDALFKRQLGKQGVLGSGFGIGVGGEKFQATCAKYGMDVPIEICQTAVRAYRALHPRVPIFWTNIERAAIRAVQNPGKKYRLGFLTWEKKGDFLTCELPVGRKLRYFKPRVTSVKTIWGAKPQLSYMGAHPKNKKLWVRIGAWGGKLAENVTQAVARDVLKEALLRLEEEGKSLPVLEVHDEVVGERKKQTKSHEGFCNTMAQVPTWAKGLPIKIEGWAETRYRK